MKIIILATLILPILLFAASCAQTNSAQVSQNASVLDIETVANNSTNTFSNDSNQTKPVDEDLIEDAKIIEKSKYAVELLMDSEYYAEEVENSIGFHKGWLGLYRKKNKYFLLPTTIEVKAVSHYLRDGKDSKEKTGREISSNIKLPSVFLMKNAKMLREGEVKTVFYGEGNDSDGIDRKYRRSFNFGGREYTLFVEDSSKEDGEYLTEKSKMVISQGKIKQIIYEHERCDDCSWNLCWVGDLDADGKLDFLLNLNSHYNSTCHVLFLSSQAEKEKLVRDIAEICQQGC